jgi:N-acetylglucosamine-6-phosphate deacetylase
MATGVANLMRIAGLELADAIRMATVNPARAARIDGRTGGLTAGERADVVAFEMGANGALHVRAIWRSGSVVPL